MNRKIFIKSIGIGTVLLSTGAILDSCKNFSSTKSTIKFKRSGTNSKIGHIIREEFIKNSSKEYNTIKIDTLIIGAGVSGLSASYHLKENKYDNFKIIELDNEIGGNSKSGINQYSAYPYAAHYLPIPDINNKALINFLYKNNIIESFDENGLPFYKEEYLCHSTENRLLENKYWFEGLVGQLNDTEKNQFKIFDELINYFKDIKVNDEFVFQIPYKKLILTDEIYKLDKISFKSFLLSKNINSKKLLWYFNYCCLDDFGQGIEKISAFAGIHYFSSRKGIGANCEQNSILTWPEGNNKLVSFLKKNIETNIETNKIARHIEIVDNNCHSYITDTQTNNTELYISNNIILATPIFVRNKILKTNISKYAPEHQPWLVSTITLQKNIDYNGFGLCWDNVIYEHQTLGYIDAQHQNLSQNKDVEVLTIYKVLDFDTPQNVRKKYYNLSDDEIKKEVINDWLSIYPNSENDIIEIDTMLIAHGMCSPGINYLLNPNILESIKSINNQIHFAHTDYVGISIFEEAFEQGRKASFKVLYNDI